MDRMCQPREEGERCFERAVRRGSLTEHFFKLGACSIRLRFATPVLADVLTPPFGHLPPPQSRLPDYTVNIWHDPAFSPRSWWRGDRAVESPFRLAAWENAAAYEHPYFGELGLVDCERGDAFVCFRSADAIFRWNQESPLRGALNLWFQRRGLLVVHSAAVGRDGAILLAGRSGSGKSSTVLHCLAHSGLSYLGDDLCLVDVRSAPRVHSVYSSLRADAAETALCPSVAFAPNRRDVPRDKLTAWLAPRFADRLVPSLPLRAIVLPRVVPGAPRLVPATAGDAFRALLWTINTVPGSWRPTADMLGALTRRLPSYVLEVGPDRHRNTALIASFLGAAQRAAA